VLGPRCPEPEPHRPKLFGWLLLLLLFWVIGLDLAFGRGLEAKQKPTGRALEVVRALQRRLWDLGIDGPALHHHHFFEVFSF
jgi:hypothetical protein